MNSAARFEPDRQITREEMAVMLVRALGLAQEAQARQVTLQNGTLQVAGRSFTAADQSALFITTAQNLHHGLGLRPRRGTGGDAIGANRAGG